MQIEIVQADITEQHVDAIVNAANSGLLGGGGVDGAIHRRGGPQILAECKQLRATRLPDGLPTGQAVETTAGRLNARWVIHTVGPVFSKTQDRSHLLASAYSESISLADSLGAKSVAFPAISTGIYGWPMRNGAEIAIGSIRAASPDNVELVRFVLFSPDAREIFESVYLSS